MKKGDEMRLKMLTGARSAFMSPVPADFQEFGFVRALTGCRGFDFVDLSKDFTDVKGMLAAGPESYLLKCGHIRDHAKHSAVCDVSADCKVTASTPDEVLQERQDEEQRLHQAPWLARGPDAVPPRLVELTTKISATGLPDIFITKRYGTVSISDGWVLAQGASSHICTLIAPTGQEVGMLAARPKDAWAFRVRRQMAKVEQLRLLTMLAVAHPKTPVSHMRQPPPPPSDDDPLVQATLVGATVIPVADGKDVQASNNAPPRCPSCPSCRSCHGRGGRGGVCLVHLPRVRGVRTARVGRRQGHVRLGRRRGRLRRGRRWLRRLGRRRRRHQRQDDLRQRLRPP